MAEKEYIERDWLMKERHGCNRKCAECDFAQDGDSWCEGEVFIVDVLRAPAADVVSRKHYLDALGTINEAHLHPERSVEIIDDFLKRHHTLCMEEPND